MKTHNLSIPAYGQLWESQGGFFAGILQHPDGRLYALIVPPKGTAELGEHEWGAYGTKIEGTESLTDGAANTEAHLQAGTPLGLTLKGFEHAGHADWYIPARTEMVLAHDFCKEQFEQDEYYWTSSQYSANYAWYQSFYLGYSHWSLKDFSLRVRPVRRLFL
jgi:Protein of unknown function (DUF1566)